MLPTCSMATIASDKASHRLHRQAVHIAMPLQSHPVCTAVPAFDDKEAGCCLLGCRRSLTSCSLWSWLACTSRWSVHARLCLYCWWLTVAGMQGNAACKRDVLCHKLCLCPCPSLASSRTLSCDTVTWWSQSSTAKGRMVCIWDACMDIAKLVCCEAFLPCTGCILTVRAGCWSLPVSSAVPKGDCVLSVLIPIVGST